MNKSHLAIIGIVLCVSYGVLSMDIVTHSQGPGPESSKFATACSTGGDGNGDSKTYDMCCIGYNEAMDAVKRDWQDTLQKLVDQQKPASDMVEEGYESLRTYNCWAEYVCRAVKYSGYAPIESALGTGLRSEQLGVVPGCQKPEDLKMEKEYNSFVKTLKEIPVVGVLPKVIDQAMVENKIDYLPQCQTDSHNNQNPKIELASDRYTACKTALEVNFGCPATVDESLCMDSSTAFATLENVLRKRHADQKASALERKLGRIVPKLQAMEEHVGYLSNFLQQLNSRFECYAGKCT